MQIKSRLQRLGLGMAIALIVVGIAAEAIVIYSGSTLRASIGEQEEASYFSAIQTSVMAYSEALHVETEVARGLRGLEALDDAAAALVSARAGIAEALASLRSLEGFDEPDELDDLEARIRSVNHLAAGIVVGAFTPEVLERQVFELQLELSALQRATQELLEDEQHRVLAAVRRLEGIRALVGYTLPALIAIGLLLFLSITALTRATESADRQVVLSRERLGLLEQVTHNLRTPLSAVIGIGHELKDRIDSFTGRELEELASVIVREGWQAADSVEGATIMVRHEERALAFARRDVDLASCARVAAGIVAPGTAVPILGHGRAIGDSERVAFVVRTMLDWVLTNAGSATVSISHAAGAASLSISPSSSDRIATGTVPEPDPRLGAATLVARYMGGELHLDHSSGQVEVRLTLPAAAALEEPVAAPGG